MFFFSTISVDFIFVDFDRILDKFIYLFGFSWGNYFLLTLPSMCGINVVAYPFQRSPIMLGISTTTVDLESKITYMYPYKYCKYDYMWILRNLGNFFLFLIIYNEYDIFCTRDGPLCVSGQLWLLSLGWEIDIILQLRYTPTRSMQIGNCSHIHIYVVKCTKFTDTSFGTFL